MFSQFGVVKSVLLKKEQDYCFIRFDSAEAVNKALNHTEPLVLNDIVLHVKPRTQNHNVPQRYFFEGVPNISFTTIMVQGIPEIWRPQDLHNCFSIYGPVIGCFIYPGDDRIGLVEFGNTQTSKELCLKLGVLKIKEITLEIFPTDVVNLSEWLGYSSPDMTPKFPPGLGKFEKLNINIIVC